jgi:hypothetical protein
VRLSLEMLCVTLGDAYLLGDLKDGRFLLSIIVPYLEAGEAVPQLHTTLHENPF